MKYGIREAANIVIKAKSFGNFGKIEVVPGQPVLMIDTATTSSFEGNAETTYANGGRGNARLLAWEGDKTLTFTIEDALISPIGLSILSGAGFIAKGQYQDKEIVAHVHNTKVFTVSEGTGVIEVGELIDSGAPVFVIPCDNDGNIVGKVVTGLSVDGTQITKNPGAIAAGTYLVDYYTTQYTTGTEEIQINASDFAGTYYVEGETLWREQYSGKDVPAQFVLPNAKIQSNFTITMAASGDPSTFTFTMDCLPGKTMFNPDKEVLMALQLLGDMDRNIVKADQGSVFSDGHTTTPMLIDTAADKNKQIDKDSVTGTTDTHSKPNTQSA